MSRGPVRGIRRLAGVTPSTGVSAGVVGRGRGPGALALVGQEWLPGPAFSIFTTPHPPAHDERIRTGDTHIDLLMADPTILVIEDAREHAVLVRVAARRALPGLDVRVAGDGREGLAYLAGTPPFQDRRSHPVPTLIILDLLMPETDGFAVLEWMGEQRGAARIPIVVLTSSANPEHEERAMGLGAQSYHNKPANIEDLGEVVREIVEQWVVDPSVSAAPAR